mmetsp:Transcript_84064/g.238230  ORF Transcript_84064/g.238230 Transcript_84064/m.238230 type:complete len:1241 (+) Transcript_84064:538-4260(+)
MEEQRRKQRESRGLRSRSVSSGGGIGSLLAPIPAASPPKSSGLGALFRSQGGGSEHDQNQQPNTAGEGGAHTKLPFRRPPSYSKNLESAGEIAGAINTTPKAWEQHYTVYLNHLGIDHGDRLETRHYPFKIVKKQDAHSQGPSIEEEDDAPTMDEPMPPRTPTRPPSVLVSAVSEPESPHSPHSRLRSPNATVSQHALAEDMGKMDDVPTTPSPRRNDRSFGDGVDSMDRSAGGSPRRFSFRNTPPSFPGLPGAEPAFPGIPGATSGGGVPAMVPAPVPVAAPAVGQAHDTMDSEMHRKLRVQFTRLHNSREHGTDSASAFLGGVGHGSSNQLSTSPGGSGGVDHMGPSSFMAPSSYQRNHHGGGGSGGGDMDNSSHSRSPHSYRQQYISGMSLGSADHDDEFRQPGVKVGAWPPSYHSATNLADLRGSYNLSELSLPGLQIKEGHEGPGMVKRVKSAADDTMDSSGGGRAHRMGLSRSAASPRPAASYGTSGLGSSIPKAGDFRPKNLIPVRDQTRRGRAAARRRLSSPNQAQTVPLAPYTIGDGGAGPVRKSWAVPYALGAAPASILRTPGLTGVQDASRYTPIYGEGGASETASGSGSNSEADLASTRTPSHQTFGPPYSEAEPCILGPVLVSRCPTGPSTGLVSAMVPSQDAITWNKRWLVLQTNFIFEYAVDPATLDEAADGPETGDDVAASNPPQSPLDQGRRPGSGDGGGLELDMREGQTVGPGKVPLSDTRRKDKLAMMMEKYKPTKQSQEAGRSGVDALVSQTPPPRAVPHRPIGYVALDHARIDVLPGTPGTLDIESLVTADIRGSKHRVLIQFPDTATARVWLLRLRRRSKIRTEDLFKLNRNETISELGHGRFSSVQSCMRRTWSGRDEPSMTRGGSSGVRAQSALKVVNKVQFWDRVDDGRERCDTLVREIVTQATASLPRKGVEPGPVQSTSDVSRPGWAGGSHVVRFRSVFETLDELVIEMELMEATDLFDRLSVSGPLDEATAASVARDLVHAIAHCQSVGIAHRDIKLSNITFDVATDPLGKVALPAFPRVKLADFGMAAAVGRDGLLRGRCGTPGYVAPEILKAGVQQGYGSNVDMFSAGAVVYSLLCGYEPFYGANDQDLIIANKDAVCEFHVPEWDDVSDDAKDFVRRMLDPNPNTRLSPARALKHPWLTRAMAAAQWSDTPTGGLAAGRLQSLPGVQVIYDSDDDMEGSPEVDRSWMKQRQEQAGSAPPKEEGTGCVIC